MVMVVNGYGGEGSLSHHHFLGTLLTASLPFLLFMNILFFLLYAFCTVVERALSLLGLNDNAKIRRLVMSLRRY